MKCRRAVRDSAVRASFATGLLRRLSPKERCHTHPDGGFRSGPAAPCSTAAATARRQCSSQALKRCSEGPQRHQRLEKVWSTAGASAGRVGRCHRGGPRQVLLGVVNGHPSRESPRTGHCATAGMDQEKNISFWREGGETGHALLRRGTTDRADRRWGDFRYRSVITRGSALI